MESLLYSFDTLNMEDIISFLFGMSFLIFLIFVFSPIAKKEEITKPMENRTITVNIVLKENFSQQIVVSFDQGSKRLLLSNVIKQPSSTLSIRNDLDLHDTNKLIAALQRFREEFEQG